MARTYTEEEFQQALAKALIGEPIKMEGVDTNEEKRKRKGVITKF